jgi:hypothetical protein
VRGHELALDVVALFARLAALPRAFRQQVPAVGVVDERALQRVEEVVARDGVVHRHDELDAVVERICDRIREEIPEFRRLPAEALALAITGNVGRALAALRELRAPTAEELERAAAIGREAAAVVRALLRDTWVVGSLEGLSSTFQGVAVTRSGRAWWPRAGELRQAPAAGDEQLLAQRNRREQLLRETERVAQAELRARDGHERALAELARLGDSSPG